MCPLLLICVIVLASVMSVQSIVLDMHRSMRKTKQHCARYAAHLSGGVSEAAVSIGLYEISVVLGGNLYFLQIDTGSAELVVVSDQCSVCTVNQKYTPSANATQLLPSEPNVTITYIDGITVDTLAFIDVLWLEGLKPIKVGLAAAISQVGTFQNRYVDGLLGLAYPNASALFRRTQQLPVLDQMLNDRVLERNTFSICLDASGVSGALALGEHSLPDMKFVPYSSVNGLYNIQIVSIDIGADSYVLVPQSLSSPLAPVVDTGTTSLVLSGSIFLEIQAKICSIAAKQDVPLCTMHGTFNYVVPATMTSAQVSEYPVIAIGLQNDVTIKINPPSYLRRVSASSCVVAISDGADVGGMSAILGDVALLGYTLHVDRTVEMIGIRHTRTCEHLYALSGTQHGVHDGADGDTRSMSIRYGPYAILTTVLCAICTVIMAAGEPCTTY